MLNKFSKLIMFYFAYLPLFVLLSIENIQDPGLVISIVCLLIILGYGVIWNLLHRISKIVPSTEKIKVNDIKNSEYINFLASYVVLLLIDVSGVRQLLSWALMVMFFAYLYVGTSLFYVNPLLKPLFGFNILEVTMGDNKYYLLSKKELRGEVTCDVKKLDRRILITGD